MRVRPDKVNTAFREVKRRKDIELVFHVRAYVTRKGRGCYPNGPHDVPDEVFTKEYWDRTSTVELVVPYSGHIA